MGGLPTRGAGCRIGKVRAIAAERHEPYTLEQLRAMLRPCRTVTRPGYDPRLRYLP